MYSILSMSAFLPNNINLHLPCSAEYRPFSTYNFLQNIVHKRHNYTVYYS